MSVLDTQLKDSTEVTLLPDNQRKEVAKAAMASLTPSVRQEVTSEIGAPSQSITDRIWLVIMIAIALVLVIATGVLGIAFVTTEKVDSGTILALFTAVMGFIGGLFTRSPLS